jgi:U3 small nucleolar RNA-associated protein 18
MNNSGNSNKKRARQVSAEEQHLAEAVFGNVLGGSVSASGRSSRNAKATEEEVEVSLSLDRSSSASASGKKARSSAAAWDDDDDDDLEVDLRATDRLRKLQKADGDGRVRAKDSKVTGKQLSGLLQDRFQTQALDWAVLREGESSMAAGLLQSTGTMLHNAAKGKGKGDRDLPSGRLDVQRVADANAAEPSKKSLTAMQFHSSGAVLMAAGADRFLRFFQVDGDRNEHLLAVRFNDTPIACAAFVGSSGQVVLSGRKPFFYAYDTESGKVTKVPGLQGKQLKSYEHMIVSPLGSRLAFLGTGGYVHIADARTKAWTGDVKMNTAARSAVFSDENSLVSSGLDADIYRWDLRMAGRCVNRFKNADGTCVSSLAVGKTVSSSFLAAGSESGVLTLYDGASPRGGLEAPATLRTAMNLTSKVTAAQFHPSAQCMAYASPEQNDHLRVLHVATGTVFSNWPTKDTPLRKVQSLAFSPGGGYFAVGNDRGKVLLYRLNHFGNY